MAEEKTPNKAPPSLVPEVKRKIMAILVGSGMDPALVDIISVMDPFKIQLFIGLYQAYSSMPDYVRKRAEEILNIDMADPHIKKLLEDDVNRGAWDREKYLDWASGFYRKVLVMRFVKTAMHEYMNTLASSQERASLILTTQPDKVRIA